MAKNSPKEIWSTHLSGDSSKAASMAKQELDGVRHAGFNDFTVAVAHAEYARLTEVTARAAAKKSLTWSEAKRLLELSLHTVIDHYPLSSDRSEAERKGNYWEGVLGEQSAQLICLRDVLHLAQILGKLLSHEELNHFIAGLHRLLENLSDQKAGERFALIFLIEEAPYDRAKQAYQTYLHKFVSESGDKFDLNQAITVNSRFLGRCVAASDFDQFKAGLETWLQIFKQAGKLRTFAIKELTKNLSTVFRDGLLDSKYQLWSKKASKDKNFRFKIEELLNNVFVGVAKNEVREIGK